MSWDKENKLEINHEYRKNISIFHIKGTLTMNEVPIFNKYINTYSKYNNIALEMEKLNFIDSSGIGAMISILSRLKSTNGNLYCYNLNDDIMSTLKMAKLETFLEILSKKDFNRKFPTISSFEDILKKRNED
jgi:anti-sigma B factor antagonist